MVYSSGMVYCPLVEVCWSNGGVLLVTSSPIASTRRRATQFLRQMGPRLLSTGMRMD